MKADRYVATGVPIVRGSNITETRRFAGEFVYVADDTAAEFPACIAVAGDLVFPHRGAIGRVGIVENGRGPYLISTSMMKLRVDQSVADPNFVFYYFRSRAGYDQIMAHASTVGTPGIGQPLASMKRWVVPLPSLVDQQRIAAVCMALDRKIDANNVMPTPLRDLAVALLQAATEGRSRRQVGDVATVRRGLSYTGAGLAETGMPMVNLANAANFGWLKRDGFKYYTGPYKPRHVAPPGSLLVAAVEQTWRAEILGWPLLLPDDVGPALFSQDLFLIDFVPGQEWLRLPLWAYLYTAEARARVEAFAYGTTVARFPVHTIADMVFPVPDRNSPALELAEALLRRAWAAEVESRRLAELRDVLLPGLMSGRIRLKDAEGAVAEAV